MNKLDVRYGRPVQCCGFNCNATTLFNGELPSGWIAESWPTHGGGAIKFVLCFPCRHRQSEERWDQILSDNGTGE